MAVGVAQWDDLLQGEELAYLGSEPARDAVTAPLPDDLPSSLRERLEAHGVTELYSHQALAWEATQRGEHVAITTGTASGKSLAFNLPVLAALTESRSTARSTSTRRRRSPRTRYERWTS